MENVFAVTVKANWDDDANVWYVDHSNLPGLVAEGSSIEELEQNLFNLIPELLELNQELLGISNKMPNVPLHIQAQKMEQIKLRA